jgi:hypothetical protein
MIVLKKLSKQSGVWSDISLFTLYFVSSNARFLFDATKVKLTRVRTLELYADWIRALNENRKGIEKSSRRILIDFFPIEEWLVVNSLVAINLQKKYRARLESYGSQPPHGKFREIYWAMGAEKHNSTHIRLIDARKAFNLFRKFRAKCRAPIDIFELRIGEIYVGEIVYDSILRTGVPTVDPRSKESTQTLFRTIQNYLFCEKYFTSNEVTAVILSHDNYVDMGLIARYSNLLDIPVYLANCHEIAISREPYSLYQKYRKYPLYFSGLTLEEQESGLNWARSRLTMRISGQYETDSNYQKASAFSNNISNNIEIESTRGIVIATHCFFDSPHGIGGMLYEDFFRWVVDTARFASRNKITAYLKTHPDYLPGTLEVISEIKKLCPEIHIISADTTWQEIYSSGLRTAVTCYGTIGTELPFIGFTVINASYNPRIGYSFNQHAKSKEEYYRNIINAVDNKIDFDPLEILEFYFLHYKFTLPDNFIFESYDQIRRISEKSNGEFAREYLKHENQINAKVLAYLNEMWENNLEYAFETTLKKEIDT